MSHSRPSPPSLRHVALFVSDLEAAEQFYVGHLGYQVEWRPDPDNVYLTSGGDNLALHRGERSGDGPLDHIGFVVRTAADVDAWAEYFASVGIELTAAPRTHRDGARSLYLRDPAGIVVQIIYHPPISPTL
jgi:catechol 2,3-dioxygenase-like lactoylglutathione lyase family enzyme